MVYEHVDYKVEGLVGIITLNRPEVMNALSFQTHQELAQAIEEADKNSEVPGHCHHRFGRFVLFRR